MSLSKRKERSGGKTKKRTITVTFGGFHSSRGRRGGHWRSKNNHDPASAGEKIPARGKGSAKGRTCILVKLMESRTVEGVKTRPERGKKV